MQTVGFVLFNEVQAMDILAPYELFDVWQTFLNRKTLNLYLISQDGKPVNCANPRTKIEADYSFQDCPTIDYLVIPGGSGRIRECNNPAILNFIRTQAETCRIIASVCTGAFLLQKAGLLTSHKATTYWRALNEFRELHPTISQERIVKSGKIWSAGGISSGLDIALDLIREIGGNEAALQARLLFEYFPSQAQESLQDEQIFPEIKPYSGQMAATTDLPHYIKTQLMDKQKGL